MTDKTMNYDGMETKETGSSPVSFLATGIGNRISAAADLVGTTISAATAMGISVDSLQRYIREERVPPLDASAALCRSSGVRLEWLAFDTGPMLASETALQSGSQSAISDVATLADAIAAVRAVEAALDVELSAKAMAKVVLLACDYIKAGKTAAQLVGLGRGGDAIRRDVAPLINPCVTSGAVSRSLPKPCVIRAFFFSYPQRPEKPHSGAVFCFLLFYVSPSCR